MNCKAEIKKIVDKLGLQKLWDDDFIKEDYGSNITVQLEPTRARPLFNWAYYLIPEGSIFPLHKLLSDESWQYCLGGPIDLYLIKNNKIEVVRVGPSIFDGEQLLHIVERETWFAASPAPGSGYTLITHCVSPGWVPEDDIPGYYDEMIKLAPEYSDFVKRYSWPKNRKAYVMHESYKKESA